MSSISPAMTVKNTYPTSFSIQNLPQTSSDKRPVSFRTGLISIEVEKAVTAELMQNISQGTSKFLQRSSSRCFVIQNHSADAFQLECAVSFISGKPVRDCSKICEDVTSRIALPKATLWATASKVQHLTTLARQVHSFGVGPGELVGAGMQDPEED